MDSIITPELSMLKSDEFYLFYEMMMQSLKTDNVKEGINKSLFLLKRFLDSGNILLYKKNKNDKYVFRISDTSIIKVLQPVSCIVNKTNSLVEQKEIVNLELNLSKRIQNMTLLHIKLKETDSILVILNVNKEKELESLFWERVRETMQVILKRAASYERNVMAVTTDLLTGLDNRNSYEMRIQKFNESDNDLVFGIFDLFRLKYVNDNYTHAKGDIYIKEAANILSKYWPKYKVVYNDDGTEDYIETGHCVYRIGGDEFVLLTTKENIQLAEIKANLAKDESYLIDLGIEEKTPLGLNHGMVVHNSGDYIKQTFARADEIMQEDKQKMYIKHNLDRRL